MPGIGQPKGLAASRTEATAPSGGRVELLDLYPFDTGNGDNGQLCDPFSTLESDDVGSVIDQQDAYLAPVSGIDQPWSVDDADAVTSSMTRARQDQTSEAGRDRDCQPGGHGRPLPRLQGKIDTGVKIDRGIADMSVAGNWQFPIQTYEVNLHGVQGHRAG